MSLVVSIVKQEAIVLAAESMTTKGMRTSVIPADAKVICDTCNGEKYIPVISEVSFPDVSTLNTNKVCPFFDKYAIGHVGAAVIGDSPIESWIKRLELEYKNKNENPDISDLADRVGEYFCEGIRRCVFDAVKRNLANNHKYLEFTIVGFKNDVPLQYVIEIGKYNGTFPDKRMRRYDPPGLRTNIDGYGDTEFLDLLMASYASKGKLHMITVEDMIDLARFCIESTIQYRRFHPTHSYVGGKINIAYITPFEGFKWVSNSK